EVLTEHEVAVDDRERVTVERPNRRAGDAVAFRVVRTAVARTAKSGGKNALQGYILVLDDLVVHRAVRLHRAAEMDTPAVDDREARLLVRAEAVVADV